jgi:hypothetical protein
MQPYTPPGKLRGVRDRGAGGRWQRRLDAGWPAHQGTALTTSNLAAVRSAAIYFIWAGHYCLDPPDTRFSLGFRALGLACAQRPADPLDAFVG